MEDTDTDTDVDEEVVDVAVCPKCSKMTEHEVLRRTMKGNGEDLLARCVQCSNVQNLQRRPPKPVFIKTTLSDRMDSKFALVDSDDDELICKDDYFQHEELTYKITRIEDSKSKEAKKLEASKISAMWAVRVDRTIVPLTMTAVVSYVITNILYYGYFACAPIRSMCHQKCVSLMACP